MTIFLLLAYIVGFFGLSGISGAFLASVKGEDGVVSWEKIKAITFSSIGLLLASVYLFFLHNSIISG